MDYFAESVKQLPVGFAIWRISDQLFVYANDHALRAFGTTSEKFGKVSLWDIIGPQDSSLILAETIRSNPYGGPDIQVPSAAFATFKRIDNGSLFVAWFQAADIIEVDGSINYRVALIFTDYDENINDERWQSYVQLKANQIVRVLAGTVAHDVNNALAVLQNEIEKVSIAHNLDLKEHFKVPFEALRDIGLKMFQLAEFPESITSINSPEALTEMSRVTNASQDSSDVDAKFRVLVVDDDPTLLAGLVSVLKMRGLLTTSATNSKEALFKAEAFQPSAALVDLVLGDEDGHDLGQKLKESLPELNLVFMTGFAITRAHLAIKAKHKVLKKPFDVDFAITLLKDGKGL